MIGEGDDSPSWGVMKTKTRHTNYITNTPNTAGTPRTPSTPDVGHRLGKPHGALWPSEVNATPNYCALVDARHRTPSPHLAAHCAGIDLSPEARRTAYQNSRGKRTKLRSVICLFSCVIARQWFPTSGKSGMVRLLWPGHSFVAWESWQEGRDPMDMPRVRDVGKLEWYEPDGRATRS